MKFTPSNRVAPEIAWSPGTTRGYLSTSLPGFVNHPWRGFFHFKEIVAAHRDMEENRAKGKLVVVVDSSVREVASCREMASVSAHRIV